MILRIHCAASENEDAAIRLRELTFELGLVALKVRNDSILCLRFVLYGGAHSPIAIIRSAASVAREMARMHYLFAYCRLGSVNALIWRKWGVREYDEDMRAFIAEHGDVPFEYASMLALKMHSGGAYPEVWPWIQAFQDTHKEKMAVVFGHITSTPPCPLLKEGGVEYRKSSEAFAMYHRR